MIGIVHEVLLPLKWKRKNASWFLESPQCGLTINVQKSAFGNQFYLNWGVSIRAEGLAPTITYYKRQLYGRIKSLPECSAQFAEALNFDSRIQSDERKRIIQSVLTKQGLPFLQGLSTLKGIHCTLMKGQLREVCVNNILREVGIEPSKYQQMLSNLTEFPLGD